MSHRRTERLWSSRPWLSRRKNKPALQRSPPLKLRLHLHLLRQFLRRLHPLLLRLRLKCRLMLRWLLRRCHQLSSPSPPLRLQKFLPLPLKLHQLPR